LYLNTGTDSNPLLTTSGHVQANGSDIDVGNRSVLTIVDWDNDGRKDLIIGDYDGYANLFLNTGTNDNPAFGSFVYIQSSGIDIKLKWSAPEVCDLNMDGKKDLLLGEEDGFITFYANTGTDANPSFSGGERLTINGGSNIDVGMDSAPEAVDWDEDGFLDILTGAYNSKVTFFENSSVPSAISAVDELPLSYQLSQNYPNPFNPKTTINYELPITNYVVLTVYDALGQKIKMLVNRKQEAGRHKIEWNAENLKSGVYFYQITVGGYSEVKKCILVK